MRCEEYYVNIICKEFQKNGFLTIKHVRILPQEIDLIAFDPISLVTISVEVKLKDWKKVIYQSIRNKKYSHYNFVALPINIYNKIPIDKLRRHGLGLIVWQKEKKRNNIIVKEYPSVSDNINRVFKKKIYELFNNEYSLV